MRYLKYVFILIALTAFSSAYSQDILEKTKCDSRWNGEVLNWAFGKNGHLVFSDAALIPQSDNLSSTSIELPNGTACISDSAGNLLLFADGKNLYAYSDGNAHQITSGLLGATGASQSSLFIPVVDGTKYLLFTTDMYIPPVFEKGLNYVKVEKVNETWTVSASKKLLDLNTQKITAVRHANGKDFWLLTHGWEDDGGKYFAFQIINDSVCLPVESEIGVLHEGDYNNNAGYMKASSDGSRIALILPSSGIVEVSRFDNATGVVSNPQSSLENKFSYGLGLEFSPDNSKLYVSTNPLNDLPNKLYQIDVSTDPINFDNAYLVLEANPPTEPYIAALQLGADGRIYVARHGPSLGSVQYLDVIYNPDRTGSECNYNKLNDGIDEKMNLLDGTGSKAGLPNFVCSFLDIPYFSWTNHCQTYPTVFELRNKANNGDVIWKYYSENGQLIGSSTDGIFTFPSYGKYRVEVTETYNDIAYIHDNMVEIFELPKITLNGTTDSIIYILPNTAIKLDAGEFEEYIWEKEDETEQLSNSRECVFDAEGNYSVTVTDTNCCVNTKYFEIRFSDIFLPTAFRPNSNIAQNQIFKVSGGSLGLKEFVMRVFDRWGQLIFETDDAMEGWNGKMKNSGAELSSGTYVYYVYYKTEATDFQESKEFNLRGAVVLVR